MVHSPVQFLFIQQIGDQSMPFIHDKEIYSRIQILSPAYSQPSPAEALIKGDRYLFFDDHNLIWSVNHTPATHNSITSTIVIGSLFF